ncbi:MAG: substrate-binding domain-containing protein [Sphingobacteriia bacterium]|nr:substrate-binding domain-containing protein [Sphingobacteriia bacterium]
MKLNLKLLYTIIFIAISNYALARDVIRIAGSSSIYPIITIVAEEFGYKYKRKIPIVESVGTGGGFKLFCSGIGDNYADIVTASRPIKKSEIDLCKKNGIHDLVTIKLGHDGIVFVTSKGSKLSSLSINQLFKALTNKKIYEWNEVDASLPKSEIMIYGPDSNTGNYEIIYDQILKANCTKSNECFIRNDGVYIENGNNQNIIMHKVLINENSIGIIPYTFFIEHDDEVNLIKIDNILPSYNSIKQKKYKLSRELLLYVKVKHIDLIPGLKEFISYLKSDEVSGEEGMIAKKGIITK